jgi:hypothetical protein
MPSDIQSGESSAVSIRRDRRKIDLTAIIQTAALTLDPERKEATEERQWKMACEIEANAHQLAGPSSSPLVQSLALTVALTEADVRSRQVQNGPLTRNQDGQRNLDRAMRRYLAACKALAAVQRLNLPTIQVNIAGQQVVANQ